MQQNFSFLARLIRQVFIALVVLVSTVNIVSAQDTVYIDDVMYVKKETKAKYDKKQFKEHFVQGNLMMLENFIDTAIGTFSLLHSWDPKNANVNFKLGQLYLRTSSDKYRSVEFLEAAAPKVTRSYDPDDPGEKGVPGLVYFLLGQAYHLTYRFDEAIAMFAKFKKVANMRDLKLAKDIERRIKMCETGKIYTSSPVKCVITNLGDSINSEFPEYGAVITADESSMFFTSRRLNSETGGKDNRDIFDNYYEDIWVSNRKEDGTWSEAKPLTTRINSWYNEAVIGISVDGQQLLLYKNDKGGSIYYSKLDGDQWSYPYMLGTDPKDITDINTDAFEPSACFSADGNTLYFVSDRDGGYGGRDIYKCIKLPTGRWSKATNLGPTINTPFDEDAPFMHPDGATMFFSSNGHNTMGGFDIFFTMLGDSGWFPPQNIGYPINTTDDDIFYVMSTDGMRSYFSSLRPEGKGEKDLYMVTLPKRVVIPVTLLKGHISFAGIKDTMMSFVTITATDMESGQVMQEVHPNSRTLKYILPLNPGRTGKTYSITFEADGYRPYNETISVSPEGEYREIDKDFDFKNLGSVSVFGTVGTRKGDKVPEASIKVYTGGGKSLVGTYKTKEDGSYLFDLPANGGEQYTLSYEATGYIALKQQLDLPTPLSTYDFERNVYMQLPEMLGTISLTGTVKDQNNYPLRESIVVVADNKSGAEVTKVSPDKEGTYFVNLERGKDYNISFEAEGYLFHSENLNVPKEKSYSEKKLDVVLAKIEKGKKIVLSNVFFDSGKSKLRKESNVELDKVVKLLNDAMDLRIEIGGHTDNSGKKEANLKLSQARADAVVQYLIIEGIDRNRLIGQGYGDAQPIAPNEVDGKPNKQNMQENRRVEFKILEDK